VRYNRPAMPRTKRPEDLSEQELRRLLLDKRHVSRRERLERFRRTGRVVNLAPDLPAASLEEWRADVIPDVEEPASTTEPFRSRRRRWIDRILTFVEVMAVLGLVGVILNGLGILRTLNAEVAAALQQPTLEPTPLISAVVLPSGHTPPNVEGVTEFNQAEIPSHLLPIFQSQANIPVPTPGISQAVRIQIPAIGVDAPIVQGDGWEQLKKGVGQHIGSANPGQNGNLVLAGHNDVYGEVFRYLENLKVGEQVIIYTQLRQYVYTVTETRIVEPTQVEIMSPTASPTVTLISCYPYLVDNKRIVVFGKLQNP